MPTVTNTLLNPLGAPIAGAVVKISLIASTTGPTPGYLTSSDIVSSVTLTTDVNGMWSASLTGNAAITPANTYYQINETGYISYAVVPTSGGPFALSEVIVALPTPSPPGITGVQVAANGTVAGVRPQVNVVAGTGIGVSAVDNPGASRVDVTFNNSGVLTTRQVLTTAPLTGGGDLSADRTIAVSDATTGAKGVVQLAGDLAGTAALPTVPGLTGKVSSSIVTTKGDLLVGTAAATIARLGVGADGQALVADSTQTAGIKWASGANYRGTWAASTAYNVGDLVTLGGELLRCQTAHTSGSTFSLTNWANLTGKPGTYNVMLYGATGSGKTVIDGAMTSGSATLTSATASFTSADVGKAITVNGAGAASATLSTTIAGFTNSTTVTLTASASTTVSSATVGWGTDDTAAINSAFTAGYNAGVANGTCYAEIHFPAGVYTLSSATIKGGSPNGNAQVPVPFNITANDKFDWALTGVKGGEGFAHWEQTFPSTTGSVLRTTLVGQTLDGTWGAPSVIGGPTVSVGTGVYSNTRVVVDGLTVVAPYNPSIVAFDFRYLAQARIVSAAAVANAGVVASPALNTKPTNSLGLALRMPQNGNNDEAVIGNFACEGFYYGLSIGEHLTALRIAIVYFSVGIFVNIGGGSFHGATIVNLNAELGDIAIQTNGTPGASWPLDIAQLSVESISTYEIDDGNNVLRGQVNYACPEGGRATPRLNGGTGIKVISTVGSNKPGNVTAPGIPASTTPLTNPFWRDAAVNIVGGTVSAIAVDGVATGLVPPATVIVPSGRTVTLTYTVAPTSWVWTLL